MVRVRKATVLCYRFFDIAEGIDLERVRATLQKSTARLSQLVMANAVGVR